MSLGAPARIAIAAAALALVWTAFLASSHVVGRRSFLDPIEAARLDARTALFGVVPVVAPVTVVAIDDRALASPAFGFPIRRDRLGALVAAAMEAGATTVALDILLVDPGPAEGDAALAAALRGANAAIAAAGRFGDTAVAGVPEATAVFWPARFAADAEVGFVNVVTDLAGTPQHVPLLVLTPDGLRPHFVLVAASLFAGVAPAVGIDRVRLGERELPLDIGFQLPLRLAGPAGTVPTVSAHDVLDGRARLDGTVAVVGATATAFGDTFNTPFGTLVPGAEVLAGAIAQFFGGPVLSRTLATRRVDAAAAGVVATGAAIAAALLPLAAGVAAALGLVLAWLAVVVAAFGEGVWLAAALPVIAAVPVAAAAAGARHLRDRRKARRAERAADALARLQSPALAARIAADPGFLAQPVATRLAVLFIDLTGFTGASERLGLDGTAALLKAFHGTVASAVEAREGMVLNYFGDGALAAFGLPHGSDRDADDALATAFALVPAVRALGSDGTPMDLRIGVHRGRVLLSRLGGERHEQVTISGDVVNVAARLMEVAKEHGATVVASAAIVAALSAPPETAPDRRVTVPIRGRVERVEVAVWRLPG